MKLIDVVNAHNMIDSLSDKEGIGAHLAYMMTKFVIATQSDADFYTKEIRKLFDRFGKPGEGGNITIEAENIEDFQAAVTNLQNTEAVDPDIRLSLSELSKELKLSMKQIYPLMAFIKEDVEC
jgi:hypothetical protein